MSRGRQQKRRVLEAAGVGHRITHEDDLPEPREILATVARWGSGEVARQHGDAPLLSAILSSALNRISGALSEGDEDEDRNECPDPCGEIEVGSPDTFIGKERQAAALVDDEVEVPCENDSDGPVVMGAAHVWVNGKRWARRSDELDCGALIGEGEATVLIGAEADGQATRVPRDPESWTEPTVHGAMRSSGRFDELESGGLSGLLSAVLGGAAPPGSHEAELRRMYQRALAGAWGPDVARRVAAGDLSALEEVWR